MKKLVILLALAMVMTSIPALAFNAEGLPIVDETVTFSMLIDDSYTAEDHAIMYNYLEEQTGVHVDLQLFPYATAVERMNVMLSTGNMMMFDQVLAWYAQFMRYSGWTDLGAVLRPGSAYGMGRLDDPQGEALARELGRSVG